MSPQVIIYSILSISCIGFLISTFLEFLNLKHQRKEIPDSVAAFYDKGKYFKSLEYHREQTKFGFISSGFSFLLSLGMLVFGGFGWLDNFLRSYFSNSTMLALVFFGIIALISDWLSIPFQWYSTFVIEEKYGFNKTTFKTFIADKLKGYALGAIVGGGLLVLFIYLVEQLGQSFWIWFGLAAALFVLFINMFYTSIILPLFNKLTPLPAGELKEAITAFASKVSFPLDHIYVIDGSKRSAKANAFFSGIGKKKKIVLYDTLIEKHTTEELVAVLAHEVGHFKRKHIIWGYLLAVIQIFLTLWVLSLILGNANLSFALGGAQQTIHLNLVAFGILFSPISGFTGLFMSMLSRKNEFEADAYARSNFNGEALANALKKLSVDTLSNLFPHPVYVFFHYSHPPLLQRLESLQKK